MGKNRNRFLNIPPEEKQTGLLLWFQMLQNHGLTLFHANLLAFLSLVPGFFCLYLLLSTYDLVFWAAGLVCVTLAGPSITALHGVCARVVLRRPVWVSSDFREVWKRDWKTSMALTAVLGLLWSGLAYAVYLVILVDGGLSLGHLLMFGVCGYLLMGVTLFGFQQAALLELPLTVILKNACLMIFAGNLRSVFAILVSLGVLAACVILYGYALYILLAGAMALTIMTANLIFAPVFRRLFLTENADEKEA